MLWLIGSSVFYWWFLTRAELNGQNRLLRKSSHLPDNLQEHWQGRGDFGSDNAPKATDERSLCETVHIAVVCMSKCTRLIIPMLKSLLYHRQNPIHFHIIVDPLSEHTTKVLFDTWDLPDVLYTCYDPKEVISLVEWIPNTHYSGVYTLVKLLLPDLLPLDVKRVIVLDADLTFVSDVFDLWSLFRNMSDQQYIGMVENESNWYLESNRWPALGRGFNTGVVLFDLDKMRSLVKWTALWQETVRDNLGSLKQTMLGDQDIVNAIVKRYPHSVFNISCQYNVQMSTLTFAKKCYGEDFRNVKIIHWNSPSKYAIKLPDADYFRTKHRVFVNLDGYLLKWKLHRCSAEPTNVNKMNSSVLCQEFRQSQLTKFRTHLYYFEYSYESVDTWDVTLVVQLSMDRLQFLERLVKYWRGPLSVAVYLSDYQLEELESLVSDLSETLSMRRNIGYHLVFKQDGMHYPINYLRNVALESVSTPFVFLTDVDFVPMLGLYEHLRAALRLTNPAPQKKCLVVPALESQRYRQTAVKDKTSLLASLTSEDVVPFRLREWPAGHRATNYTRWINATKPYEVEWEPDYEPYIVGHRSMPKYDTRFSGFGWNKVSHGVELQASGYRLLVLPAAFVVHAPHAPSRDISAFRSSHAYRLCLSLLKQEFLEDLKKKYASMNDIANYEKNVNSIPNKPI